MPGPAPQQQAARGAPLGAQLGQDAVFNFSGGMDSYTNPQTLPPDKYVFGENIVCRGGIVQTRPGSRVIFGLPCGQPQMLTSFTPTGGNPQLVVAVNGKVYISATPFQFYQELPNIQFYPQAKYIAWAVCVQTTAYDQNGNLYDLPTPQQILVMQDGFTRAAYYDGFNNMHLNPGPSGVTNPVSGAPIVTPNTYGTPVGLWMAWSGNRLWVSNQNQLFASNIGNPLTFSEGIYLSGFKSFVMPENITGLAEPYYGSPLIVFGATTRTFIQSEIQDRAQWAFTPGMQLTEKGIGCVSHRSIVRQFGLVWWYSQGGLINLNQATQNTIDSYVNFIDDAMSVSKGNLSPDKSGIAACAFEKYMVHSVPSGDVWNRHTWVLDQSRINAESSAYAQTGLISNIWTWNGIWTGWRPVEWTTLQVNGSPRCFFLSADTDGVNRIWEAFLPDRNDNGQPITCAMQSGFYGFASTAGIDNIKDFRFTRIEAKEVLGTVDIWGGWCGTRGAYTQNLSKRIIATQGIFGVVNEFGPTDLIVAYKPQVRVFDTQEVNQVDATTACNQCSVEDTNNPYSRDRGFSQLLIWSGRLGITGLRFFADFGLYDKIDGSCTPDEVGPKVLNILGCSGPDNSVTTVPLPDFVATAECELGCATGTWGTGPVTGRAVATSKISQQNAQLRASLMAQQDACDQLQCV